MMAFLCQCYRPCQSVPFTKAPRDTTNPPSHGEGNYIQIFEIAFQCTLKTSQQGIPLPKRRRSRCKRTCFVLSSAMTETLMLYVKPPRQAKLQGKNGSSVPVSVPAPLSIKLGVSSNQK